MVKNLGDPPAAPSDDTAAVAECVECGHAIRVDVKRCSACGARQITKGQAVAIVVASMPLWAITFGALDMLGSVDTAFAQGFLLGMALLGPTATLLGLARYRARDDALRAGGRNGVS
jgi:hypothetical protein